MKRIISIYAIITTAFLLLFLCLLLSMNPQSVSPSKVDLLAVNRIAHQVSVHWDDLSSLNESVYEFTVFDNNGNCLFRTNDNLPDTKSQSVQAGMVCWDIVTSAGTSSDEHILGTLYLVTDQAALRHKNSVDDKYKLIAILLLTVAFTGFSLLYFYWNMIRPFRTLKGFADNISDGNLDNPLPMDRHNLFGAFTESFDLMRNSLNEANQKAISLDKSKKEMVVSLSHDIRTPVTSIKVLLELLLIMHKEEDAERQKLLSIQEKASQIEQLANNLMHSTLEDLDELSVHPISAPSYLLESIFRNADTDDMLEYGSIPPCILQLDIARARQVASNIISNSHKYAGTKITISFEVIDTYLHVCIEDTGTSLLPEEIEAVCNQYFRGQAAIASGKEGEGMGLYLSEKMMRKMGGDLEVYHCNPGFGVRLLFALS